MENHNIVPPMSGGPLVKEYFLVAIPDPFDAMSTLTPHPGAMRAVNVSVHAVFGIGLYLGAIASPTAVL